MLDANRFRIYEGLLFFTYKKDFFDNYKEN